MLDQEISRVETLRSGLEQFITTAAGAPTCVDGLKLLAGGASQEAWALDADITGGPEQGRHALVLRRDMGGALSSAVLPRAQEFDVLTLVHIVGVRTPRPYWFIPAGSAAAGGRAAFLMQRLTGETIGRRIVRDPALAAARALLPGQLAEALATIHNIAGTARACGLGALRAPEAGQSAAAAALNRMEADLRTIDEPHPALELGLRWLRAHDPGPDDPDDLVLVHGDFRIGNVVVGSEGLRGVLDWENAHLGDPHADLAWMCVRAWRFGRDDLPVGGIGARAPFYAAYTWASGRRVDPARAYYWEVLGNVRWALGALGQARRHLSCLEPSIELASLGRIAAEMELETLNLIDEYDGEGEINAR